MVKEFFQNPIQRMKVSVRRLGEKLNNDMPLDKNSVMYSSRWQDKIEIHMHEMPTPEVLREALFTLAQIIKNDDSVKTVQMTSPAVLKLRSGLEKLGFIIREITDEVVLKEIRAGFSKEMQKEPVGETEMSKEEFLNLRIIKKISGD